MIAKFFNRVDGKNIDFRRGACSVSQFLAKLICIFQSFITDVRFEH